MHIAIVVTNLPFGRDKRVMREARSLVGAGHEVTVISPRASGSVTGPTVEGVTTREYPLPIVGSSPATWAMEFVWSLVCVVLVLLRADASKRIDVVQVCNPPDVFWPVAWLARRLGREWVFDHHDLSPELYAAGGGRSRFVRLLLERCEQMSVATASAVIVTNESFRDIDVRRSGCARDKVTVVRNGPRRDEFPGAVPDVPCEAPYVVCYLGIMGAQDGVDVVVRAAHHVVKELARRDCHFLLMGDGDMLEPTRRLVERLGLSRYVELPGWVAGAEASYWLARSAVAVQPDQPSSLTRLSSMAKTAEYLAHGLPVVAADLLETRRTAGAAASYLAEPSPEAFALEICALLDDADRRRLMSRVGRRRVIDQLAWEHQETGYLSVFARMADAAQPVPRPGMEARGEEATYVAPSPLPWR